MDISSQPIDLQHKAAAVRPDGNATPVSAASSRPRSTEKAGESDAVPNTPENRSRIDRAIRVLDLFNSNHPNTRFRYSVHSDTGRIQVELYNFLTGEVVQTIPSKKLLDYAARMQELSGLILEEHA